MRGLAILLVVANHAELPGFARSASVGVTLFFVLSGFLITTLLLDERNKAGGLNLAAFYRRRALRLLPALFVLLAVFAGVMIAIGRWSYVLPDAIPAAFYYANWIHASGEELGPMTHTWSLSIEEQFYLAWPVLMVIVPRVRWLGVIAIVGAVGILGARWVAWTGGDGYLWSFFATHTRADGLLIGCALAVWFAIRPPRVGRWAIGAAVAGLTMASFAGNLDFAVFGLTGAALASAVLVAVAAQRSPSMLRWRPLVYVGTISYGLYLWHAPIFHLGRTFGWTDNVGVVAVMTATAFGLAWLSRRYVELPFLRLRSNRVDRQAGEVVTLIDGAGGGIGRIARARPPTRA